MQITTSWAEEAERSLIFRLLNRRVGALPEPVRSQIETLPIAQSEALGETLLDFSNVSDLEAWLEQSDQGASTDALQ